MKIYKYELPTNPGRHQIQGHEMQQSFVVNVVNNKPFVWAWVDEHKPKKILIDIRFTGDNVPDMGEYLWMGTAILENGAHVLHYFVKFQYD